MPSAHLGSTHGLTTSGVTYHHHLWMAQTVERRRAWYEITALGLHRLLDDVECGMTSPPLDNTHGRTMSAHTVKRHRVWHYITTLVLHAQADDVERGMTSPPLDSTHGRQHRAWHDITAL
uniref:Uncharacterized protein n=1 Tax=Solanum lycopersicum TaxID=4081 RepID=A0A494G8J6_SOLLC